MLKIEIETKGNVCNTNIIGKATVEESFFSYQAALILAEGIKQRIIEDLMKTGNINYEEAEKIFYRLIEEHEMLIDNNEDTRN